MKAIELLQTQAGYLNIDYVKVSAQLCDFEMSRNGFESQMMQSLRRPTDYWQRASKFASELSILALRILFISPSSASTERSFSLQKQIHSPARNKLKEESVEKLLAIRWFYRKERSQDTYTTSFLLPEDLTEDIESVLIDEQAYSPEKLELIENVLEG